MNEMNTILDMIDESGLDAGDYAGVATALASLSSLVPSDAPPPSDELAALLSGTLVIPIQAARSRRSRITLTSSVAAAVLVLGTGVAAASNSLPRVAQQLVSDFSHKYLPFDFPDPEERADQAPSPTGRPGDTSPGSSANRPKPGKATGQGVARGARNSTKPTPVPTGKPDTTGNSGSAPETSDGNGEPATEPGQIGDGEPAAGQGDVKPSPAASPTAVPPPPPAQGAGGKQGSRGKS